MAIAFEFTGTIAGGAFIGWYLDRSLGWAPWGSVGATVLAAVGAFVRLLQMLHRFERLDDASQR